MYKPYLTITMAGILGLLLTSWGTVFAEKPISTAIRDDISQTMAVEKKVQDMKAGWSGQSKEMANQLERLGKEAENLKKNLEN